MSPIPISPRTRDDIIKEYPIASSVTGWFFRCTEVSNNVYLVEGCDIWGRKVSRTGTDEKALISDCEADARSINSQVKPAF
jgi:hypothetical protein